MSGVNKTYPPQKQVLKNIEVELQEKNATVEVAPLCEIPADRNLMQLVIQNLIQYTSLFEDSKLFSSWQFVKNKFFDFIIFFNSL